MRLSNGKEAGKHVQFVERRRACTIRAKAMPPKMTRIPAMVLFAAVRAMGCQVSPEGPRIRECQSARSPRRKVPSACFVLVCAGGCFELPPQGTNPTQLPVANCAPLTHACPSFLDGSIPYCLVPSIPNSNLSSGTCADRCAAWSTGELALRASSEVFVCLGHDGIRFDASLAGTDSGLSMLRCVPGDPSPPPGWECMTIDYGGTSVTVYEFIH